MSRYREGLHERLEAVWQHAIRINDHELGAFRYIPVGVGQGGWHVWDRKAKKFVLEVDLMKIPVIDLVCDKHHDA